MMDHDEIKSAERSPCPSLELLEELAADGMSDDSVREHVDACTECSSVFEQIRRDNDLLSEFVSANTDVFAGSNRHPVPEIEGYEIFERIGTGAQGVVYRAKHTATHRLVALKVLLRGSFVTSRQRRRFEREIEILAGLRHENIVTVYDSGTTVDGHLYLAMEFVNGQMLTEYVQQQLPGGIATKGDLRSVLALMAAICDGVAAAHQRGNIHRDLKPMNILVDSDGVPRVLDFGLARHAGPNAEHHGSITIEGGFHGTFAYAAPEQFGGVDEAASQSPEHSGSDADVRSDVYSLGAILYELLTGRKAHGEHRSIASFVHAVLHDSPANPATLNSMLDTEVQAILLKALARDPQRRYQSAGELAADLRRWLAGEAVEARRDSRWYAFQKAIQRNKAAAGAAVAVAVTLVGFAAVMTILHNRAVHAEIAAQQAAELERQQRLDADQSRAELERVSTFQAQQLGGVDPAAMALTLRTLASEAPIDELNFTDAVLQLLDEHVFGVSLEAIEAQFADQPLVMAQLLKSLAETQVQLGMLEQAGRPLAMALQLRQSELGDEHELTLQAMHALGDLLREQGRYEEATAMLGRVIELRSKVLGESHRSTLEAVHSWGTLLLAQGRPAEAETHFRFAQSGLEALLGPDHVLSLTSLNSIGVALQYQGRLEEAEAYLTQVLELRRSTLGDAHLQTLRAFGTLGDLRRQQGRLDEAEEYYRRELAGYRQLLGDRHPRTLAAIHNLCGQLHGQGRYEEAETLMREVIEGRRAVLGSMHPETILSIANLGGLLREMGELAESEALIGEAVAASRQVLADDHWQVAFFLAQHGRTLMAMGRFAQAEAALLEAHERFAIASGGAGAMEEMWSMRVSSAIAEMYHAWHEVKPDAGHDASATLWHPQSPANEDMADLADGE